MNLHVKLNAPHFVCVGAIIIVGGVLAAIQLSIAWPLLAILPGLLFVVRLVRDSSRSRLPELNALDSVRLEKSGEQLFGVVGRWFVMGPFEDATIAVIEGLLEAGSGGVGTGVAVTATGEPSQAGLVNVWQIEEVERIEFTSGANVCVVSGRGRTVELRFATESERDKALEMLFAGDKWHVRTRSIEVFAYNLPALLLCLGMLYFGVVTFLCSTGLMGINQLPVLRLAEFRERPLRGKGRALGFIYAVFSECFLFLVEQLHPVVGCLVGLVVAVLAVMLISVSQRQRREQTVWSLAAFGDEGQHEGQEDTDDEDV